MGDQKDLDSDKDISSFLEEGKKCGGLSSKPIVCFKIPERDLFSPLLIIPLAFLLFLSLAFISYLLDLLDFPSIRTPLAIIFSLFLFIMSVRLCEKIPLKFIADFRFQLTILVLIFLFVSFAILKLYHSLFIGVLIGIVFSMILNYGLNIHSREVPKKIPIALVLVSISILIFYFIFLGGFPLLSERLRERANLSIVRAFSYMSFIYGFSIIVSCEKNNKFSISLALIGLLLFSLLGFRFEPMGILLTLTMAYWYRDLLSRKAMLLSLILLAAVIVVVGYMKVPSQWILNPIETLFYRAGFTLNTLDRILEIAYPFGLTHGLASFSPPRSRIVIGLMVYGYNQSITSTLIGAAFLDFGLFGIVLIMIYFGLMLGIGYKILKNNPSYWCSIIGYLLAASHSLILIESGVDFTMWLFTLFVWLLYGKFSNLLTEEQLVEG